MAPVPMPYTPEDRQRHGKALDALTDQQYAFVCSLATQPAADPNGPKRAAIEAGYDVSHKDSVGRLLRMPRIVDAIRELAGKKIEGSILKSLQVADEIMESPTHKDRLKAAKWVAELGGFVVKSEQKITVDHGGLSAEEQRAELRMLMAQMGPDATRLLAAQGLEVVDTIDAEFTVIEKTALAPDGEPW